MFLMDDIQIRPGHAQEKYDVSTPVALLSIRFTAMLYQQNIEER